MRDKIIPVGLKGNEINERMKELMGIKPINENKRTSAVELTKVGPDGNVYAIVKENHEYYIKTTTKKSNLVTEDFSYIGGLQNKKSEAYPSYSKALKHLNLKFNSLNEAYGKSGQINVFEDDNLLNEMGMGFTGEGNLEGNKMSECCGAPMYEGMCSECGGMGMYQEGGMEEYDKPAMHSFQKQYGGEKGKNIYYATANKQDRDPETFEKNEGMGMMDEKEFPDLTGDGKVTYADILKGRGVDLNKENEEAHIENEYEGLSPELEAVHGMMEDKNKIYWHVLEDGGYGNIGHQGVYASKEEAQAEVNRLSDMFPESFFYFEASDSEDEPYNVTMEGKEMTDKQKKFAALAEPKDKITYADKIAGATKKEGKLSIEKAITEMDSIIESIVNTGKKKVYTLK